MALFVFIAVVHPLFNPENSIWNLRSKIELDDHKAKAKTRLSFVPIAQKQGVMESHFGILL